MAVHQAPLRQHMFPWGLELLGAALIGAALLFSTLLILGHSDLLPSSRTGSEVTTQAAPYDGPASAMRARAQAEYAHLQAGAQTSGVSSIEAQARAEAAHLAALGSATVQGEDAHAGAMAAQAKAQYLESQKGVDVSPGR